MPAFQYKVRDPLGRQHEGSVTAASRAEAGQQLSRDGFQVLALRDAEPDDDGDDGAGLLPRRVKKSDIIYATSQLAIMVDTGITLATALQGLCEQEENPTLRALLSDLKEQVEGGEDFSVALARHPKYFDRTFIAMIRASEETGSLGEMLERVAGYLRKELETRAKVRAALAYPSVMLTLAIGVTIFLLTYVLPKFEPLFQRDGFELPTATKVLLVVSGALLGYWWAWLAGIAAAVAGFLYARRHPLGRLAIDWVKINLPIVGPMLRKVAISRSVRTLGTMVHSGVSMLDAIRLSADVSGNSHYEQAWLRVLDDITQGKQICEGLRGDPLFPRTLVQMIGSGEETGKLDYVLAKISDYYDQEVEVSLKAATSVLEPLMITGMGVVIGGIGLGLLLPIFSLSSHH